MHCVATGLVGFDGCSNSIKYFIRQGDSFVVFMLELDQREGGRTNYHSIVEMQRYHRPGWDKPEVRQDRMVYVWYTIPTWRTVQMIVVWSDKKSLHNLLRKKISGLCSIFFFFWLSYQQLELLSNPRIDHLSMAFLDNIPSLTRSFDSACLLSFCDAGLTSSKPREALKYSPSSSEMQLSGLFLEIEPLFSDLASWFITLVLRNICAD